VNVFVPAAHVSENLVIKKSLKVGDDVKIKIWQVKSDGTIIGTRKKALLNEEINNIYSVDVLLGTKGKGVITEINQSKGLAVYFYNGVKGIAPAEILQKQGVTNFKTAYRIGQVIDCIVLSKFSSSNLFQQEKLIIGLALQKYEDLLNLVSSDISKSVEILGGGNDNEKGKSVLASGNIVEFDETNIYFELDNGVKGNLHYHQIFDIALSSSDFMKIKSKFLKIGMRFENMIILKQRKTLYLSIKPLLLKVLGIHSNNPFASFHKYDEPLIDKCLVPDSYENLYQGNIVVGYILKIGSFGVLVGFLNLVGLIPHQYISNFHIDSIEDFFNEGDSIRCAIHSVDLDNKRIILSCKSNVVSKSEGANCYLATKLHQEYIVSKLCLSFELNGYFVGQHVTCVVVSK
jgi:ribosomal protein S1